MVTSGGGLTEISTHLRRRCSRSSCSPTALPWNINATRSAIRRNGTGVLFSQSSPYDSGGHGCRRPITGKGSLGSGYDRGCKAFESRCTSRPTTDCSPTPSTRVNEWLYMRGNNLCGGTSIIFICQELRRETRSSCVSRRSWREAQYQFLQVR